MKVLSLFDGMSCGQIALARAGIKVDEYLASEIDPFAISVTQYNYPNTQQLGDVNLVDGTKIDNVDLLIGGSPCTGFSVAGKQLNFNDPKSKLFFEYLRILKQTKPKYFLLENVVMRRVCRDAISEMLNTTPILIDSALVSAQNRKRYYWTNLPNVTQPIDRNLFLKDILEPQVEPLSIPKTS